MRVEREHFAWRFHMKRRFQPNSVWDAHFCMTINLLMGKSMSEVSETFVNSSACNREMRDEQVKAEHSEVKKNISIIRRRRKTRWKKDKLRRARLRRKNVRRTNSAKLLGTLDTIWVQKGEAKIGRKWSILCAHLVYLKLLTGSSERRGLPLFGELRITSETFLRCSFPQRLLICPQY